MRLGDSVIDQSGLKGQLVANIDRDEFSTKYPKAEWAYLIRGMLIKTDQAGVVHYENANDLALLDSS